MRSFFAILLTAATFPIWGGALAAVIGGSFYLLFTNPVLLVLLIAAIFLLGAMVK